MGKGDVVDAGDMHNLLLFYFRYKGDKKDELPEYKLKDKQMKGKLEFYLGGEKFEFYTKEAKSVYEWIRKVREEAFYSGVIKKKIRDGLGEIAGKLGFHAKNEEYLDSFIKNLYKQYSFLMRSGIDAFYLQKD